MEKAFILILVALFLGWMYVQQRRLRKYEQYCMDMYKKEVANQICISLKISTDKAQQSLRQVAKAFRDVGYSISQNQKIFSQNVENKK